MKKILLALFAFIAVGNISAYTITFNNNTPYPLQAWVNYSGAGICSADMHAIPANARGLQKGTAACCTFKIEIRRVDGPGHRVWPFSPPSTGAGIACRSFSVNIGVNPDGTLILTK